TLTNCTLSGNSAGNDGGGIFYRGAVFTAATLNNTVVAGNSASSGPDIFIDNSALAGSYNLIGNGTGQNLINGVDGNIVGTDANPIDPMLGPLQDNGGPTHTHVPLPGSPLIDAGSDLLAVDSRGNTLLEDQRNFFSRMFGTVDIGAVEYQPDGVPIAYPDALQWNKADSLVFHSSDILANDVCNNGSPLAAIIITDPEHGDLVSNPDGTLTYTPEPTFWGTDSFSYKAVNGSLESNTTEVLLSVVSPQSVLVTTIDDEDDGDLSPGDISLREALADASTSQVQFDVNLFNQTIRLELGALDASNVQIVGLGTRYLSIDGQDQSSVFHVTGNSLISHLTISGGLADQGGGINNEGTLTLTNSMLSENRASDGGGIFNEGTLTLTNSTLLDNLSGYGGGIFNIGKLTLTNCTLSGNFASVCGGGIYNNGNNGTATLTVTNSTLLDNSTEYGDGGGIFNDGYNGTATLTNSTLSGNSARYGGGFYNKAYSSTATLTVTNCTLSGNSASNDGGGLFHSCDFLSVITLTNCTLSGNAAGNDGGGIFYRGDVFTAATLNNTVVAVNSASSGPDIFIDNGTLVGSHNLIGNGTSQPLIDGVDGNLVGSASSPIDPCLGNWIQFANGLWGYELLGDSPAINAGSNDLAVDADGNPLETDIAGARRIQNGIVEIGAYEYTGIIGDANMDGTVNDADAAILAANWLTQSGATWLQGDFNDDGQVNDIDATLLATNWQATSVSAQQVPGDANGDGVVDVSDLGILVTYYGAGSGADCGGSDFTGDGFVDVSDLGILATNYKQTQTNDSSTTAAVASDLICDLDNDGQVGLGDLAFFSSVYGEQPGVTTDSRYAYAADFDGSGTVDLGDLGIFSSHYRQGRTENLATPQTALTSTEAPAISANSASQDVAIAESSKSGLAGNCLKQPAGKVDYVEQAILARHWMMAAENTDDDTEDARGAVFAEIGAMEDALGLLKY
ncbi:MAG: cadherin-like domain-containing protein, partial [Pirellulales bacterium]|nr:cadherin-like domain-containing protein [Pirellulales bacterium]